MFKGFFFLARKKNPGKRKRPVNVLEMEEKAEQITLAGIFYLLNQSA